MSRTLTVLILLAMATPHVFAQGNDVCLATADTPVCHHYFERQRVELSVRGVLDKIDTDCGDLVVNILQRQGLLLAQLGEPIQLDDRTCPTMTELSFDLPDVRSETDVLVQFTRTGSSQDDGTEAVIALRVYPDTLLDPLTSLAKRHSLVIYDDQETLSSFLDDNEIDYVQGFGTLTGKPIGLFVRPANAERLLEGSSLASAVIFREAIVDLPQVRIVSASGQTRVYVEMPVLEDLRESPLAQKALLRIIRLAIEPVSIDRG